MRRILGLIVAVVASAAGQALIFWSHFSLTRDATGTGPLAPDLAAFGGMVLLGACVLTGAWSSLGTWIVGGIEIAAGLVAALVGTSLAAVGDLPTFAVDAVSWYRIGAGLLVGSITVAAGAALRSRRLTPRAQGRRTRVISVLAVLLFLAPSTALTLTGGVRNQAGLVFGATTPDPLGLVVLLVGDLLVTFLVLTVRWSGVGAIVGGAVLMLSGFWVSLSPLGFPAPLPASALDWIEDLDALSASGLLQVLGSGAIILIGMLFLFAGIASVIAGRRVHHRATWVEPVRTEQDDAPTSVLAPE